MMDSFIKGLFAVRIHKRIGKRYVVRDVTLGVQRGEIVGLLGPNGAGKTTCFYMMMGLIRPDTGSILLDGVDITRLAVYRRARLGIGYLPQEVSIFRGLSVQQNILAVLEVVEKSKKRRAELLEQLLFEFHLQSLKDKSALTLSGGERRRVEIARTLAAQPSFILFDEPLTGIDPLAIQDIHVLIHSLRRRNIGILITDHNVQATLDIVDRVYILYDGSVFKQGTVQKVINDTDVQRVYLGQRMEF